jgi:hypothetical protein
MNKTVTYIDDVTGKVQCATHIRDPHLLQLYALLVLTKGSNITLKDVHDAWAMNMNYKVQTPYCYGHEHRSIVPFEELSKSVQEKDRKYVDALNKVAKDLERENSKKDSSK